MASISPCNGSLPTLTQAPQAKESTPIATLFQRLLGTATPANLRAFFHQATILIVPLEQLERYLTQLENASIVTSLDKFKTLFLHAAHLGNDVRARYYASQTNYPLKQLLFSLMATQRATRSAVQLITKTGVDLTSEEFSIATLDHLMALGADGNTISIQGHGLLLWALQHAHEPLLQFAIKNQVAITPEIISDPEGRAYFTKRLGHEGSPMEVLHELKKMGFSERSFHERLLPHALAVQDSDTLNFLLKNGMGKSIHYADMPLAHLTQAFGAASFADEYLMFLESFICNTPLERFSTPYGVELVIKLLDPRLEKHLKLLFERGYDIMKVQKEGRPLFQHLVAQNNRAAVATLIAAKKVPHAAAFSDGTPLLFWLMMQKTGDNLAKVLLDQGIALTCRGRENETLLHLAARNLDHPQLQTLINSRSIDIHAVDRSGRTALYYALGYTNETADSVAVVSALLQAGSLPFSLGERLIQYVNFIQNKRHHLILCHTSLWKRYEASRQTDFHSWFLTVNFQKLPASLQQEALECALFLPQIRNPCLFFLSAGDYVTALVILRKKYPQAPFEYFYEYLLKVDVGHFKNKILQLSQSFQENLSLEESFAVELKGFRKSLLSQLDEANPQKYRRFGFTIAHLFAEYYETRKLNQSNPQLESCICDFSLAYNPGAIFVFTATFLQKQKGDALVELFKISGGLALFEGDNKTITKDAVLWFLKKQNVLQERAPELFSQFIKQVK